MGPGGEGLGLVESFDEHVGLGWLIELAPSVDQPSVDQPSVDHRFMFHCTAIADGSRVIDVGRTVSFSVGPAGPGRWEAVRVEPR